MGLYLDSGYVNIEYIMSKGMTYNFVVGGRGTGKTYTAIKTMLDNNYEFIYMRRTQTQLENICTEELSPFQPINLDTGKTYLPVKLGKNSYSFNDTEFDEDGNITKSEIVCKAIALSTVSNLRGFSAPRTKWIIYDEFIPEKHEKPIKEECIAFLNCVETVNRNRELISQPPVRVLCLANANDFANPLFVGLKLVKSVEKMIKNGNEEYINPQRGVGIFLLQDSPISRMKADTALYKLTGESGEFAKMALQNIFVDYDESNIRSLPLREVEPVFTVGELTVYRHKSERLLYVTSHKSGSVPEFPPTDEGIKRMKARYKSFQILLLLGTVYYESHFDKALMGKYLTMGGK